MPNDTVNRIHNSSNPYQGDYKKVLCVCSAGLLRSPTAALVLSQDPFNFNTRACGSEAGYALIALDEVLVLWADEIVVMDEDIMTRIWGEYPDFRGELVNLAIDDSYRYRDPVLMDLIKTRYQESVKHGY